MDLLDVRTAFIQRSGRYDLVVDAVDFVDAGADFFINAGQRMLDRMDTTNKSWGRRFLEVVSGDYYTTFKYCRAIKEVWVMDSSERVKLTKVDISELREYYDEPVPSLTSGTPKYYAPAVLRPIPDEVTSDDFVGLSGFDDVLVDWTHYEYNGVMFMPKADGDYVIEVWGLFYSPELSLDADENWWTLIHPEILIKGALYQLEVFYRNTEGANDWMRAISVEMAGLGKDFVEEHIAEVTQMGG